MTTEERKLLTCHNCNETNDPGMLFCIHCGTGLTASAEKIRSNTTMMGGKCPACGKQDDLNMRFCIFCSSPMVLDAASQRPMDKFSWEMELADNELKSKSVTSAALKFKDAVQKSPTKKAINYLPYGLAFGAAFGLLALVPRVQDAAQRTYLSGAWPAKSLTVYTKHPFAEVTLYQPSDAKVFTLAEADANGAVRFTNLEAGDYNMKITGKGLRTAFQQVSVDGEKPTVIGYGEDKRVELERDPSAAPADVVSQPEPNAASSATEPVPKLERPATEVASPTADTKAAGDTEGKSPVTEKTMTDSATPEPQLNAGTESKSSETPKETPSSGSTESKSSTGTESTEKP
ncbi:MAG: zinc ribbon domain-containing protein [Cyanobacteria bacterium SZAS-4]|nr:zinc ribbon domain-containing protein [Cyanobacteria bacterium SZAS-4]